jgi:FkbH-like protein
MRQLTRILRYAARFVGDRKYRNRILDLVQRHVEGAQPGQVAVVASAEFLRSRRLFVVGGCEHSFMSEYLANLGMYVSHTFSEGRASDPMTEFMTPGSRGLSESWDYYLLSATQVLRDVVRRLQLAGLEYPAEELERDLDTTLDNYRQAVRLIRGRSSAPIFLFSYLMAYIPTYGWHEYRSVKPGLSLVEMWHLFHAKLYQFAREFPAVYVFDADLAAERCGKSAIIDPHSSSGMYDHPTREGARVLGDHFVRLAHVLETKRRQIKCAVFDLDGTLWSGVLREDGPAGVAVQEYYLNVLEMIAARGILLAICSKNDPGEASHLPDLLGKVLYARIVSRQLSWKPKSQMLRDVAEELNIGLDSLAFFDDSPFERAEVCANAPDVLVLTPHEIYGCLNLPEFQQPGEITSESLSRTAKYQQQARRKEAERTAGPDLEQFLRGCELKLELRPPAAGEISRVYELLQRTNQLNATLARTSQQDLIEQFEDQAKYVLRIARLQDRFGDYGLVGCVVARVDGRNWEVLDLAFSCRAMGRGVEQAVLAHVGQLARSRNADSLTMQFVSGPRNQQMFQVLQECGFRPANGAPANGSTQLDLERPLHSGAPPLSCPAWLKLESE